MIQELQMSYLRKEVYRRMDRKNIVATLYLKDGKAVRSPEDFTEVGNVYDYANCTTTVV